MTNPAPIIITTARKIEMLRRAEQYAIAALVSIESAQAACSAGGSGLVETEFGTAYERTSEALTQLRARLGEAIRTEAGECLRECANYLSGVPARDEGGDNFAAPLADRARECARLLDPLPPHRA